MVVIYFICHISGYLSRIPFEAFDQQHAQVFINLLKSAGVKGCAHHTGRRGAYPKRRYCKKLGLPALFYQNPH